MKQTFKPMPAESVGLITNYRCSFSCRHCLYCSSPGIREDVDEEAIHEIIDQIDHFPGTVLLHVGGGEPLVYFELAKRVCSHLKRTKIEVEYLETNGLKLIKNTSLKLRELKNAGLDCLLLSISPFHNEFIAVQQIKRIMHEIVGIFGRRGIFPWHAGYLQYLEEGEGGRPISLEKYFSSFSTSEIHHQLTSVMYIHPGGRAAYLLADYLPLHPAEKLLEKSCVQNLGSPIHAHVDYQGNYLAGFCSGIRIGKQTGLNLDRLYTKGIELSHYPLLDQLVNNGLKGIFGMAIKSGFVPDPEGYVSPCHLCLEVRRHLFFQSTRYEELYPRFFYEDLSKQK